MAECISFPSEAFMIACGHETCEGLFSAAIRRSEQEISTFFLLLTLILFMLRIMSSTTIVAL